jgi:hypothetical protein
MLGRDVVCKSLLRSFNFISVEACAAAPAAVDNGEVLAGFVKPKMRPG